MAWRKRGLTNRGGGCDTRLIPHHMGRLAGGIKNTIKHKFRRNIGNEELCNPFFFRFTLEACGMLLFISILVGWLDMINSCIAILSVVLFYLSFFFSAVHTYSYCSFIMIS
ncbi:hypothetical protein LI328DRAFT_8822 [Trichoderma asperelloides]|nr:hypothetical protein LI328DRAFT_8822 [Trichoderma asperelloides]